jgi:hypothetical protein
MGFGVANTSFAKSILVMWVRVGRVGPSDKLRQSQDKLGQSQDMHRYTRPKGTWHSRRSQAK